MVPLIVLLILWLLFLWKINTKTVVMPGKGDESPSGCQPPAPEDDGKHLVSTVTAASEHNEDNGPQTSIVSGGLKVKSNTEALQTSSVNSGKSSLPSVTQTSSSTHAPTLSSGPEVRERLKFILGASEDWSSDEELAVSKPPCGTPQPVTSNQKSLPQRTSCARPQPSASSIK